MFCRGRLQKLRSNKFAILQTKSAMLKVWFAGIVPPEVYPGDMINVIGRLRTFNGGTRFEIVGALPVKGRIRTHVKAIAHYLWQYAPDPRTYVEKPSEIDMMKVEDYKGGNL